MRYGTQMASSDDLDKAIERIYQVRADCLDILTELKRLKKNVPARDIQNIKTQ